MSLEKFRELTEEQVLPTTTLDTIESWKKGLVDNLGWSKEDVESMATGELYIIDRDKIHKDKVEEHFGVSEEETEELNKDLPIPESELEGTSEESDFEVKVVESADDIDAPDYTDVNADTPTQSVDVLDVDEVNIDTPEWIATQKEIERFNLELDELRQAEKNDTIDTATFTFKEVDDTYNQGITDAEKRAFVVYMQTLLGKKLRGGFNEFYPMPLIEGKESNNGYVLGQELKRGTIQTKEFVLLLENLLNTETENQILPFYQLSADTLFKLFYSLSSLTPANAKKTTYYPSSNDSGTKNSDDSGMFGFDDGKGHRYALFSSIDGSVFMDTERRYDTDSLKYKQTKDGKPNYQIDSIDEILWTEKTKDGREIRNYYDGFTFYGGGDESLKFPTLVNSDGNKATKDDDTFTTNFNSVDAFGGLLLSLLQYGGYQQLGYDDLSYKYGNRSKIDSGVSQVYYLINPKYLKSYLATNPKDKEQTIKTNIGEVIITPEQAKKTLKFIESVLVIPQFKIPQNQSQNWRSNSWLNREVFTYFLDIALEEEGDSLGKYTKNTNDIPKEILELIENGDLYYDGSAKPNERYQPKWKYQSGSIYDKYGWLINNKEIISDRFGDEVMKNHLEAMSGVWEKVESQRLKTDSKDEKMRLTLLPTSSISRKFIINEFIAPDKQKIEEARVKVGEKNNGRYIDLLQERNRQDKNKGILKEFTLYEAFIIWLREGNSGSGREVVDYNYNMDLEKVVKWYLNDTQSKKPDNVEKGVWLKLQDYARQNGDRLFRKFLAVGLDVRDKLRLELLWNRTYLGMENPDLNKIPIGFEYKKYFGNEGVNDIRKEKLEAIRYYLSTGSCCLAYGVGIGKTWCANFILAQILDMGIANRPLFVLPNQVYTQFSNEMSKVLGNVVENKETGEVKIGKYILNEIYNASAFYRQELNEVGISDETITICTYEGFEQMGLKPEDNPQFQKAIIDAYKILKSEHPDLNVEVDNVLDSYTQIFGLVPKDIKNLEGDVIVKGDKQDSGTIASVFINDKKINFDFICVDEAHNYKKLFTSSKTRADEKGFRSKKNRYKGIGSVQGGSSASKRAEVLFFITQYIQKTNRFGNTLLLTATPFTNSPLEVWAFLSYLNYPMMKKHNIEQIADFFDSFAKVRSELQINTSLKLVRKNALVGWNNLISLQKFVLSVIDKKGAKEEDELVVRPNKILLPLKSKIVNKKDIPVSPKNKISTTLKFTDEMQNLMERIKDYSSGKMTFEELCDGKYQNTTEFGKFVQKKKAKGEEDDKDETIDITDLEKSKDKEAKAEGNSARLLKGLSFSRQLALSPYFYKCSGKKGKPTPKQLIEESPKLNYIMQCIKSVKDFHDKNNTEISGQVIYMDVGVSAFPMLRDYLVNEIGYKINDIGMISGSSKNTRIGKKSKSKSDVANAFNGFKLNDKGRREELSDEDRVKVVIGSSSIKEGINLQERASVLYNSYVDYNPTDNIQLEGRIWRQGNRFSNVRIVMPLMENSADIFMFQKLEEKTKRINEIWNVDGMTNEINIDLVSPTEIKYDLITDVVQLGIIRGDEEKVRLEEEKNIINSNINKYNDLTNVFTSYDKIYKPYDKILQKNTLIGCYMFLSVLRDDLLTKPLYKKGKSISDLFNAMSKIKDGGADDSVYYDNFNYTMDEMMALMKLFNLDKKVVYPLGYSEDWYELDENEIEQKIPIMLGDEVSYKEQLTRRELRKNPDAVGKKKQDEIAEVLNDTEEDVNEVYKSFIKNIKKRQESMGNKMIVDKLLKTIPTLKDFYIAQVKQDKALETIKTISNAVENLDLPNVKPEYYYLVNDEDAEWTTADINKLKVKKIVKGTKPKKKKVKEDEERKYITYGTKKFFIELSKISYYQTANPLVVSSKENPQNLNFVVMDNSDYLNDYLTQYPIKKYVFLNNDLYYNSWNILCANTYDGNKKYMRLLMYNVEERKTKPNDSITFKKLNINYPEFKKAMDEFLFDNDGANPDYFGKIGAKGDKWGDLIESMEKGVVNKYGGGFKVGSDTSYYNERNFYDISYPREVKQIKKDIESQLMVLNPPITSKKELLDKIESEREKRNKLQEEVNTLDSPQRIEEFAQEERAKQQRLLAKGFRKSADVMSRVGEFANSNPEYLGNKMLNKFTDKFTKSLKGKKAIPPKVAKSSSENQKESVAKKIKRFQLLLKVSDNNVKKELNKKIKRFELLLKTL